jgi:hypothetical protein
MQESQTGAAEPAAGSKRYATCSCQFFSSLVCFCCQFFSSDDMNRYTNSLFSADLQFRNMQKPNVFLGEVKKHGAPSLWSANDLEAFIKKWRKDKHKLKHGGPAATAFNGASVNWAAGKKHYHRCEM